MGWNKVLLLLLFFPLELFPSLVLFMPVWSQQIGIKTWNWIYLFARWLPKKKWSQDFVLVFGRILGYYWIVQRLNYSSNTDWNSQKIPCGTSFHCPISFKVGRFYVSFNSVSRNCNSATIISQKKLWLKLYFPKSIAISITQTTTKNKKFIISSNHRMSNKFRSISTTSHLVPPHLISVQNERVICNIFPNSTPRLSTENQQMFSINFNCLSVLSTTGFVTNSWLFNQSNNFLLGERRIDMFNFVPRTD